MTTTTHCPRCQTAYEIEPARLPATKIRLRCNRCEYIFPFELESQSVVTSTEVPFEGLPSLSERTPTEGFTSPHSTNEVTDTARFDRPEGEIVNVEEVSQEFTLPKKPDDDDEDSERTEVAVLPKLGKWVGIVGVALGIAIMILWVNRPRPKSEIPAAFQKVEKKSEEPPSVRDEIPYQKIETAPNSPILKELDRAKVERPTVEKSAPIKKSTPTSTPLALAEPTKKEDVKEFSADYDKFTPTSFERLRLKLQEPLKRAHPSDELLLIAADVHSYLGRRTGQASWISYAYQAASRYRSHVPNDARGIRALAFAHLAGRQYSKALALSEEALAMRPEDPIGRYILAMSEKADEGKAPGFERMQTLHKERPQFFPATEALAAAYLDKENYKEGRHLLKELMAQEPNDIPLKAMLGSAYEGEGKWLETSALFEEVTKEDRRWTYRVSLARAYRKTSRGPEARKILDELLQKDAKNISNDDRALIAFERGKVEFEEDKFSESLVYLKEAYRLNPSDVSVMQFLAGALYRQERYAEAAEVYAKAAKLKPNDSSIKRYLGMSRLEAGDLTGAEKALQEVVLAGEEDASLYYHLARIREGKGDKAGAIAYLERAIQKDPSYSNAQVRLAKLRGN